MCVCVCVCLCVCLQVFSRAVSAVGTNMEVMVKHHGRSVQQETGAALATERRFPAASYSTGCALFAPASRRSPQLYTPQRDNSK